MNSRHEYTKDSIMYIKMWFATGVLMDIPLLTILPIDPLKLLIH